MAKLASYHLTTRKIQKLRSFSKDCLTERIKMQLLKESALSVDSSISKIMFRNCFWPIRPHVSKQGFNWLIKWVHSFQTNRQKGSWHWKVWEPLCQATELQRCSSLANMREVFRFRFKSFWSFRLFFCELSHIKGRFRYSWTTSSRPEPQPQEGAFCFFKKTRQNPHL